MLTNVRSRSLALAAVAVAVGIGSQQALANTGTAKAVILQAIVLTEGTNLNFGTILPSASAGTVAVATNNTATPTNVTLIGGGATAGTWSATGTALQTVTITLDSSPDTLNGSSGGTMTVDTFVHNAGASPAFNGSGSLSFAVGATLHVGINQTAGNYSGSYNVTVNY